MKDDAGDSRAGRSIWKGAAAERLPDSAASALGRLFACAEGIDQATRRLGEAIGRDHALVAFLEAYWRLLMPVVRLAGLWVRLSHLRTIPPDDMRAPEVEATVAARLGIRPDDVTCYCVPNFDEFLIRVSGAGLEANKGKGRKR